MPEFDCHALRPEFGHSPGSILGSKSDSCGPEFDRLAAAKSGAKRDALGLNLIFSQVIY